MIPKSGIRFSEKIMAKEIDNDETNPAELNCSLGETTP
jgi:hypothetical protein